jgi:hypothetical protein
LCKKAIFGYFWQLKKNAAPGISKKNLPIIAGLFRECARSERPNPGEHYLKNQMLLPFDKCPSPPCLSVGTPELPLKS